MLPGHTFGKYQILRQLGRGGMGEVYLAQDSLLQRKVALKFISSALAQNFIFVERFRREAQSLAAVYHPNVVHVHSLDEIDGQLVIDMEYVEGGSLAERMPLIPLPTEMALPVLRDVLSALDWCHGAGYVHRDIKPGNVLIDVAGRARVADFGLGAAYAEALEEAMAERKSTGLLWGTPRYSPPEAWDGAAPAPGWDVFAVGVLAYELLTARAPFPTDSPLKMLREMITGPGVSPREIAPDIPEWLDALVARMLAADPSERPRDAGEALEIVESSGTPLTPRPKVLPPTRRMSSDFLRGDLTGSRAGGKLRRLIFASVVVAGSISVGAMLWLLQASATPEGGEETLRQQAAVFKTEMPDAAALAALWKGEAAERQVYDVVDVELGETQSGAMLLLNTERGQRGLLLRDRGLWHFEVAPPGEDGATIAGRWANYTSSSADMLDTGSLEGTVRREVDGGLLLQISLNSEVDGASWQRSLLAWPAGLSDCAFLVGVEAAPMVQPLLYLDLLPANVIWAHEVEALFPPYLNGRLTAPQADTKPAVDGVLVEPCWSTEDALPGRPLLSQATLRACVTDAVMTIAVEAPGSFMDPVFEIVLQPELVIPATASPRYRIRLGGTGLDSVEEYVQGDWRASSLGIEGRLSEESQRLTAELSLPLPPGALGAPYCRFNARLSATMADQTQPLAVWGWPDLEDTVHGVVLSVASP